jgi:hypothetical protein
MPSAGSAVPVPPMPVKRTTIHTNGHPQLPWTPNAVVYYAFPTPYQEALLMSSTNLLDWRIEARFPLDGKLRTNSAPESQRRFYVILYAPILTNHASLTLTNK